MPLNQTLHAQMARRWNRPIIPGGHMRLSRCWYYLYLNKISCLTQSTKRQKYGGHALFMGQF